MRFTNSPYEDFMKEKSYSLRTGKNVFQNRSAAQRLPLRWLSLLARDRLRVLLPGTVQAQDGREK